MKKSTLKKKTDQDHKNNAILLFICSRLLSCLSIVINRILFIYCNIYRAQLYKLWQIFMGFVRRYLLHSQA